MAIMLSSIYGTDPVPVMKDVINNNFIKIVDTLTSYENMLDVDGSSIKVSSLDVTNSITNTTDTLINTNGSISSGGNISCVGTLTTGGIKVRNGSIVTNNDINLSSALSTFTNMGNTILDGELILTDMTSSIVDASNELSFRNNQGNSNIVVVDNVKVAGKVSSAGRSVLIVDWSKYKDSDPQFYLKSIYLERPNNLKTGQVLKIISKINEDISLPSITGTMGYSILRDTLAYTSTNPINKGIFFTKSHQTVELIYNGINWNILSIYGCSVI